jgi:hypothetical protein
MRGPTDEEWRRMTAEQRRAYKIFISVAAFVVAVTFIKKFFLVLYQKQRIEQSLMEKKLDLLDDLIHGCVSPADADDLCSLVPANAQFTFGS